MVRRAAAPSTTRNASHACGLGAHSTQHSSYIYVYIYIYIYIYIIHSLCLQLGVFSAWQLKRFIHVSRFSGVLSICSRATIAVPSGGEIPGGISDAGWKATRAACMNINFTTNTASLKSFVRHNFRTRSFIVKNSKFRNCLRGRWNGISVLFQNVYIFNGAKISCYELPPTSAIFLKLCGTFC